MRTHVTDQEIRRNERAIFRRLEPGAGGVLLDLESGEYRHLNEVGALIWESLGAHRTRPALVAELRRLITNAPPSVEAEVDTFLDALLERGLIEVAPTDG